MSHISLRAATLSLLLVSAAATPSLAASGPGTADAGPASARRLRVADAGTALRRARLDQARLKPTRGPSTSPRPASLRITLDPETGRPVLPDADLMREFEAMFSRDEAAATEPVRIEHLADGSDVAYLGERFLEHSIVRIGADGTRHLTCVTASSFAPRFAAADSCPPERK